MHATDVKPTAAGRRPARRARPSPTACPSGSTSASWRSTRRAAVLQSPTHGPRRGARRRSPGMTPQRRHRDGRRDRHRAARCCEQSPGHQRQPPARGDRAALATAPPRAGVEPVAAAQQARRQRIPVYTVALGTADGTIKVTRRGRRRPRRAACRPTRDALRADRARLRRPVLHRGRRRAASTRSTRSSAPSSGASSEKREITLGVRRRRRCCSCSWAPARPCASFGRLI